MGFDPMKLRMTNINAAIVAVVMVMVLLLSSLMATLSVPEDRYREVPDGDGLTDQETFLSQEREDFTPSTPEESIRVILDEMGVVGMDDYRPMLKLFKDLSELEGKKGFTNIQPYYGRYNYGYGFEGIHPPLKSMAMDDGDGGPSVQTPTVPGSEFPDPGMQDRDVEEADIVKLVGDRLYVLNPYRGLQIIDLSDPDNPTIMGRARLLGTPVDLYVVDSRAYVITSKTFNFWYQYTYDHWTANMGRSDVAFRLGSEISIIDIEDPSDPQVIEEVTVGGFITDSRRVGDVLYFVSSVRSFYGHTKEGSDEDKTYVMSINMGNPWDIYMVDEVSFSGGSNHIHVTKDTIYVAQPSEDSTWDAVSTITLVDISDPNGDIVVLDEFTVKGKVDDRFQLDYYAGTFRVVSHREIQSGRTWNDMSYLSIFDVTNPSFVYQIGELEIGDDGELKATRFAGDRGYTIHLPRPTRIDPLDVLDLSDPTDPKLCDVLEIPGWVEHLEVRGNKILTIGVADAQGRQVAISLFDVTDPYEAILEERIVLDGSRSSSVANWDPKALNVLDDEGLMLIPYTSQGRDEYGRYRTESGIQIIKFDLEAGALEEGGSYSQVGTVTRTRILQDRVVSTSVKFLQVADLTDPDDPKVTAVLELSPIVVDAHVTGDFIAEIVGEHSNLGLGLCIRDRDYREGDPASATMDIDDNVSRWIWNGDLLYLFKVESEDKVHWAKVTTVDLSDPVRPKVTSTYSFSVLGNDYSYAYNRYGMFEDYYDFEPDVMDYDYMPYRYYEPITYENPLLVDEGLMVYINGGRVYSLDLSKPTEPRLASIIPLKETDIVDVRAVGRTLLITDGDVVERDTGTYYTRAMKYYLSRIDLTDPATPNYYLTLNIPGIPVGADESGHHIYTTAYWMFENSKIVRTLNVVSLGISKATLVSAHDITDCDGIELEGDRAVVTEYDEGQLDIMSLDLAYQGGIDVSTTITVEGDLRSPILSGGYMFLSAYSEDGLLVYSIEETGTFSELGFYTVDRTIDSIQVVDGTAYVVQGIYGLTSIGLG
jgi:uncharacterized secreted protein with C-terminal beta-propeller domain